jgi:hypothetical protein
MELRFGIEPLERAEPMMAKSDVSRDIDGVRDAIRSVFSFLLVRPYNMQLVDEEELGIRFEGRDIAVTAFLDPISFELDLLLWRPSVPAEVSHPYAITDLMRVEDPARAAAYRLFAATTLDAVRHGLEKMAQELQTYGGAALHGSSAFFERVSSARVKAIKEFGDAEADRKTREAAERAWSSGNFYRVAEAYGRMADRLSVSERKRLEHARKRLSA